MEEEETLMHLVFVYTSTDLVLSLLPSSFPATFLFLQGKWTVPLPKVRAVGEEEVFKVVRTGKSRRESLLSKSFSTGLTPQLLS